MLQYKQKNTIVRTFILSCNKGGYLSAAGGSTHKISEALQFDELAKARLFIVIFKYHDHKPIEVPQILLKDFGH